MADAVKIKPVEGMVALRFLDDEEEECKTCEGDGPLCEECDCCGKCCRCQGGPKMEQEAEYAIVVGVGPKAPQGIKAGQTVVVESYARRAGVKIDDVRIVGGYYIKATVSS